MKFLPGVARTTEVFALGRKELDLTDFDKIDEVLLRINPDITINCTGYTAVDDAEENMEDAMALNAEAPRLIAESCKKVGSKLIHFSTDYVFNGNNESGYEENSETNPLNNYGISKSEGEKAIMHALDDSYIIRTAWLYGPGGNNFVDTMIKLGREKNELSVVNDQFGSPTFTRDLASYVVQNFVLSDQKPGIYHLTNSGVCSWYDFAKEIFEIKSIDIDLKETTSEDFKRPAKRPRYSILKNTKLSDLRNWKEALRDYLE